MKRNYRGRPITTIVQPPHRVIEVKPDAASLFGTALVLESQSEHPRSPREVWEDLFHAQGHLTPSPRESAIASEPAAGEGK
jgi:hypothetical protein